MATEESTECQFCCRPFTGHKRRPVGCGNDECEEVICLECFRKCITDYGPRCTFCSKEIPQSHIRKNCPRAFCTGPLLEKNAEIERKHQESLFLKTQEEDVALVLARRKWQEDYNFILKQEEEPKERLRVLAGLKNELSRHYPTMNGIKTKSGTKTTFVQKCPDEGCRGYVNGSWKCGVCEKYFCSKCHIHKLERDDDHVCDEDVVKTIEHIKKNSKQCPNPDCSAMIQHAGGCRQMWCPICHTTFDYKTGEIDKGPIHNPEYFRWLRENGQHIPRNPNDHRPCDQIPDYYALNRVFRYYIDVSTTDRETEERRTDMYMMGNLVRHRNHVEQVLLRRTQNDFEEKLKDARVKYLMKEISEEKFMSLIKEVVSYREKNSESGQVYQLYVTAVDETLRNIEMILRDRRPYKDFKKEVEKVDRLREYCDERISDLRKLFGCSFKYVGDYRA